LTRQPLASANTLLGHHERAIDALTITADSRSAVTGSWDYSVRIWPLDGGSPRTLATSSGDVYVMAILPWGVVFGGEGSADELPTDPQTLENAEPRYRLALVPWTGGEARLFPEGHAGVIETVAIDTSGRWLASGSVDATIQVWQIGDDGQTSGPIILTGGHSSTINSIVFDPSAQWLVSAGDDGQIVLWDLQSVDGRSPTVIGRHIGAVSQLGITPDGRTLISVGSVGDGAIKRWNLPRCRLIKRAAERVGKKPALPTTQSPAIKT
jgi:WD40 repeat protein